MKTVRVGRSVVSRTQAEDWLLEHTAGAAPAWGYPAYEQYRAAAWSGPLEDADLLAPMLLNAGPSVPAYQWMRDRLPALNRALESIAPNADLTDVHSSPHLLGPLFDGLRDEGAVATLTQVLHRKRPSFVPVWDRHVRACYLGGEAGEVREAREAPAELREPGAFVVRMATAMADDLKADRQTWRELAGIADQPPITPLRALHIVAWHLGRTEPVMPEPRRRTLVP